MATSILQSAARLLESATRFVHLEAQQARTREEHEDYSITLRLLQLLREGWETSHIFDVACGFAVGLCHARYLYKRAERAALMRREFLSITPDYDHSTETSPDRDPADGRRKVYAKARAVENARAIKEAATKLGITTNTIYSRLKRGWSWERATSETAYQFRNLDAQGSSRHDPESTSSAHENDTPADFGLGDFPKSDGRHPVPTGARAESFAAMSVADRRGATKKRVSSPIQARLEERFRAAHRAAAERKSYYGA